MQWFEKCLFQLNIQLEEKNGQNILHLSVSVQCMFHPVNGFGGRRTGGKFKCNIHVYCITKQLLSATYIHALKTTFSNPIYLTILT